MEPRPDFVMTWSEPVPVEPRLSYRPKEVAAMHGLGLSTVYGAIYRGDLRTQRAGRAHVIPVREVERWLSGEEVNAGKTPERSEPRG